MAESSARGWCERAGRDRAIVSRPAGGWLPARPGVAIVSRAMAGWIMASWAMIGLGGGRPGGGSRARSAERRTDGAGHEELVYVAAPDTLVGRHAASISAQCPVSQ